MTGICRELPIAPDGCHYVHFEGRGWMVRFPGGDAYLRLRELVERRLLARPAAGFMAKRDRPGRRG
jgi:hypothetical protein